MLEKIQHIFLYKRRIFRQISNFCPSFDVVSLLIYHIGATLNFLVETLKGYINRCACCSVCYIQVQNYASGQICIQRHLYKFLSLPIESILKVVQHIRLPFRPFFPHSTNIRPSSDIVSAAINHVRVCLHLVKKEPGGDVDFKRGIGLNIRVLDACFDQPFASYVKLGDQNSFKSRAANLLHQNPQAMSSEMRFLRGTKKNMR